jgi:hypothetical protein
MRFRADAMRRSVNVRKIRRLMVVCRKRPEGNGLVPRRLAIEACFWNCGNRPDWHAVSLF